MAPFRNPFGKKPPVVNGAVVQDENVRPPLTVTKDEASQKSSYSGSMASSSMSIKPRKEEPSEYKLSVVNDSGVYLPPSPPEKKSFWARSPTSTMSSNHRSMLNENEPFSISRESFESYRRSFDISARSPVYNHDNTATRQSLDSKLTNPSRSAAKIDRIERPAPTDEEGFEDVGLADEKKEQPKRKSIFARFGDNSEPSTNGDAPRPNSSHRGFHLPGRKRGQSGQGAELGNIDRPPINGNDDGIGFVFIDMAGIKRKEADVSGRQGGHIRKKSKNAETPVNKSTKESYIRETATDSDPIEESDTVSQSGEDDGVSWPSDAKEGDEAWGRLEEDNEAGVVKIAAEAVNGKAEAKTTTKTGTSSKEAHAKQKVEKQERKAAKPNADSIARSKKLWERLRRKSHVPLEERKVLVAELFEIITGRVKDFVFKHDSVRVIQTALKYANLDQRKMIARELKGEHKILAESKYAKFLIGKMLVHGDEEIRDLIVPEFYGCVRRMIKHPEASWILDDIYRGIATQSQKARMLREWYGAEYALFQSKENEPSSADLKIILEEHPEKRTPIMRSLYDLVNLLVQKKTTGFTMLHDAMLQYFLNVPVASEEANNFIELLKGDEEGDLLKNLAFTKSGSRLVCLSLAYGNAKDRKQIVKTFKDTMELLAYDTYGHQVLLTMFDVIDDTVLVSKSVISELIGKHPTSPERKTQILEAALHLNARIPLIHPFCASPIPAILPAEDIKLLNEIHGIRTTTSKKDPEVRRRALVTAFSPALLSLMASHTKDMLSTSFGCQFIGEVLPEASGDRTEVMASIAAIASGSEDDQAVFNSPHAGRMLKKLVTGGRYNKKTNKIELNEPPLGFHTVFYEAIKDDILAWATGSGSFVIVALLEAPGFSKVEDLKKMLKKTEHMSRLEEAAKDADSAVDAQKGGKKGKVDNRGALNGNKGTRLLLEKLDE
ncbi:Pumilio y domain member 6 [Lecanora helva]